MKRKLPVKPADIAVILIALGATGFAGYKAYLNPGNAASVLIEGQIAGQNQRWVFPLDAEETVAVRGPLGATVVRIHGGRAWVASSPCDNGTCVAAGRVHEQGQWVACMPNSVFVLIEGRDEPGNHPDTTAW